jgi:hypothetical protein
MEVLDRSGRPVGTVTLVQPGNTDTSPPPERADQGGGLFGTLVDILSEGEPDVSSHVAGSLEHDGYLKIQLLGAPDRATHHVYASARDVTAVEDDTVHLACDVNELTEET